MVNTEYMLELAYVWLLGPDEVLGWKQACANLHNFMLDAYSYLLMRNYACTYACKLFFHKYAYALQSKNIFKSKYKHTINIYAFRTLPFTAMISLLV